MIVSILIVLFFLLLFSLIVIHVEIFDFSSKFISSIFNLILIIGGYALFVTGLKSIFIVPIIGILLAGFFLKKIKPKISFKDWQTTFCFVVVISSFFLIFYLRNHKLFIPHEDYLFWIRVGLSAQKYGVENINVFYNIDSYYNKVDLYHYFEIWAMNFGSVINHQNVKFNLFFFAYPLGLIVSCLGIRELLLTLFTSTVNKPFFTNFSVLFLALGFFFFSSPWDTFNSYFGITTLPISGMSFEGPSKMIFVLIIVITLFLYLVKQTKESFISLFFATFLYLPIFPIIILASFIWWMYSRFYKPNSLQVLLILSSLTLGFILFYVMFSNHSETTISGLSIKEWFSISGWRTYAPAIMMKVFIIPLLTFLPIYIVFFRKEKDFLFSKNNLFILLLYIICIGVWSVFVKNIDANQAFLLLFGCILPLFALVLIWNLIFVKKSIFGFLFFLLYLFPGILNGINSTSPIKHDLDSTIKFVNQLDNKKILFLSQESDLKSIYDYNERVYTGINQFILYNSTIDLLSVAASTNKTENKNDFSSIGIRMHDFYRGNSPYYKECGYLDITSKCFQDYLEKFNVEVICTKDKNLVIQNWIKVFQNQDYSFYEKI